MSGSTVPAHKRATYPAYKPSSMEWVGDVPEHWEVHRLKYTASINDEALPETTDPDYEFIYVDIGSVDAAKGIVATETYRFEDAPSRARRIVRDGDTIVSTVRTYLRAIAAIREPDDNLIVSTGFAVVRPRKLHPGYLSYALRSPFFVDTVVSRSTGVSYPAINAPEVGNIGVTLPPLDEQQAIAGFLDRETARIDALIEKKQRQIDLLQEKRSALISHAVTKGLDPNAPMKDSGIEWLGQIPKHWETRKLKYLIEGGLINGLFKKKDQFGSGTKLVNVFDVYRDDFIVNYDSLERVNVDPHEQDKYGVQSGDVFFVRSSLKLEGVGRSVCIMDVPESTVFECHVVRARPNRTLIDPVFLINFLNSIPAINRFVSLANLVTMATIDQDKIKSIEIALPPRDEQDKVVKRLDQEWIITKQLQHRINNSIETLREHRRALISAAVTGKIDVREGSN